MGGSAPAQDPNVGIAATKSAQTGADALAFMKSQAQITNNWATQDRDRYQQKFIPLQDSLIQEAKDYATPERSATRASEAVADVNQAIAGQTGTRNRQAMSMGVNPNSGRFLATTGRAATDGALAQAGAANSARRAVEGEGRALTANAVNMGMGLGVNPGTSIGLSNGAASSGASAAMAGYGQQGNLLNTDFNNRMQSYNSSQSGLGAIGGVLGQVAGALPWATMLPALSSKEAKTDKMPVDSLGAVRKMPVEKWTYKPGMGDEGQHVGPYAEDFAKATGIGDGKTIDPLSVMGVTLGAVRELDKKVSNLAKKPEAKAA